MPDFDIDFCQDRREEVIRYVQQKYGREQVAPDHHLRIAAGACGVARRRPRAGNVLRPGRQDLQAGAQQSGQSDAAVQGDRGRAEACRRRPTRSRSSPGCSTSPRRSRGFTATPRPMPPVSSSATGRCRKLVPMYRDPRSDMPVTQFNMKWVEQAGLVKFDFLGLKTLTVLKTAVDFVAKRGHRGRSGSACRSTTSRPTRCCRAARPSACSRWKVPACARR